MSRDGLWAPPRGRYDRRTSPTERVQAQRERLLLATARAFVLGRPTVSAVAELARVGRGSFYEFFDDFEHAVSVVRSTVTKAVEHELSAVLARAQPPLVAPQTLFVALAAALRRNPEASLVALATVGGAPSALGNCFGRTFEQWLRGSAGHRSITPESDSWCVLLAVGATEAFARCIASEAVSGNRSSSDELAELAGALLQLMLSGAVGAGASDHGSRS